MEHDHCGVGEDRRWQAVVTNDVSADGDFFYGVRTTGIYCRPSCRSRTPRQKNVVFFTERAAAEAAGFRACKRCRPDRPLDMRRTDARVVRACRWIAARQEMPQLREIAAEVGLNSFYFQRLFKRETGLTPMQYANVQRQARLRVHLSAGEGVTESALAAGYGSGEHLHAQADAALGMTPSAYRDGAPGSVIRFALGECTLGCVLVAGSERGICAISLGDTPEELLAELKRRFDRAQLVGDDTQFAAHVARVVGFVTDPRQGLGDLPLDIRGTVFQQRVWQALRRIPVGTTASYAQIAADIGLPRAVRAVAGACAANKLALAIPCHRVVRSDGSLSGYRWGIERKRVLIDAESAVTPDID